MRRAWFISAIVAQLAAMAMGQNLASIPACGQKCWAEAKGNSSCASGNDICLCNDSNFGYDLGWCAGMECNSADIGATIDFLYPFCTAALSGSSGSGLFPTGTLTGSITTATQTGAGRATGFSSSSGTTSGGSSSDGLSTRAKVGIGIGVAIVVLGIIGAVLLVWALKRNKKNNSANAPAAAPGPAPTYDPNMNGQVPMGQPPMGQYPPQPMAPPPPGWNQGAAPVGSTPGSPPPPFPGASSYYDAKGAPANVHEVSGQPNIYEAGGQPILKTAPAPAGSPPQGYVQPTPPGLPGQPGQPGQPGYYAELPTGPR